jgi:hypothetical protein
MTDPYLQVRHWYINERPKPISFGGDENIDDEDTSTLVQSNPAISQGSKLPAADALAADVPAKHKSLPAADAPSTAHQKSIPVADIPAQQKGLPTIAQLKRIQLIKQELSRRRNNQEESNDDYSDSDADEEEPPMKQQEEKKQEEKKQEEKKQEVKKQEEKKQEKVEEEGLLEAISSIAKFFFGKQPELPKQPKSRTPSLLQQAKSRTPSPVQQPKSRTPLPVQQAKSRTPSSVQQPKSRSRSRTSIKPIVAPQGTNQGRRNSFSEVMRNSGAVWEFRLYGDSLVTNFFKKAFKRNRFIAPGFL